MTMIDLKENERIDDLQRNGLRIIQNEKKFCFGIDAVLLSGFAKVKDDENVLDIGTGTGIIPLLLSAKTNGRHFTGIEIQAESADMARRSVCMNGLEEKIEVVCDDIKNADKLFGSATFDVITTNPPYMIGNHGLTGDNLEKAIARHEIMCNFDDIARMGSYLLKNKGRMYIVHRPFRLVELFSCLEKYKLEPKRMRMVHPFIDKEPNMVLIEALKGGNSRIAIEKPLIVYNKPGEYTDEIIEMYSF